MSSFALAPRLRADCHVLGHLDFCHVLLVNQAEVPWFILVPATACIELCDLSPADQQRLLAEITALSGVVRAHSPVTKLNVAALGNVVPQLHVHVIGRRPDDPYWPGVVWGQPSTRTYDVFQVRDIVALLERTLGPAFTPT